MKLNFQECSELEIVMVELSRSSGARKRRPSIRRAGIRRIVTYVEEPMMMPTKIAE